MWGMKGGFIMDKKIMLWIVIGVLFLVTLFLTFKAGSINVESIQSSSLVAKSSAAQSSSGMVGGC